MFLKAEADVKLNHRHAQASPSQQAEPRWAPFCDARGDGHLPGTEIGIQPNDSFSALLKINGLP